VVNLLTPNGSDFHLTQAPDTARFRSIIIEGDIMNKLTVLTAVAVLALAGCSSSKGTTSAPAGAAPLTLAQVATKAGCADTPTPSTEVGTKEGAKCTKDGHDLYLYTFADDSARDNWLKVGKAAGALGSFQQGTSWVIQTL